MEFPRLIDAVDMPALKARIQSECVTWETDHPRYEIVFRLPDEKPADFTRAIQEHEILKTKLKARSKRTGRTEVLPSFWELWTLPDSRLAAEIVASEDPHEAKWQLARKYGYKMATTFMPGYAKAVYEYFQGATVLDPCAGWGDRLTGALASVCVKKYVGFDPNMALRPGYDRICSEFGIQPKVSINSTVEYENGHIIHSQPFEIGILNYADDTFDFAFTSPPFYDYEDYSPGNPKYANWEREFYAPLFQQTARVLKPGAIFAIYIGDTSAGEISGFLRTIERICPMKYISSIGFTGLCSNKIREIYLYQKKTST